MALGSTRFGFLADNSISVPDRSLDMSSGLRNLSMSDANFGTYSSQKWAFATSILRAAVSNNGHIVAQGSGTVSADAFYALFNAANNLEIQISNGSTYATLVTNATYTNTVNWYDIYVEYDSTNGTANNRMRLWVDQVEVVAFNTRVNPSLNMNMNNSALTFRWGADSAGFNPLNGYQYQPAFFNNVLPGVGALYAGGKPLNFRSISGLKSLLFTTSSPLSALEDDYVLATNYTNNNGVTKSVLVP